MTTYQIGGVLKAVTMPLASVFDVINKKKETEQRGGGMSFDTIVSMVASIVFMILAGYLCWQCNVKEDTVLRVIYTILAIIFNFFYLIYYFIYHYLMSHPCNIGA